MVRKIIPILTLLLTGLSFLAGSCTRECFENKSSIPLAGLYDMDTKKSVLIDSLTVYGIGAPNDSTILNNQQDVTQIYLPLPVVGNSTQFVFHYDQKAISDVAYNDTLTLNYTPRPYFASYECGAMYVYDIIDFSYTRHIIDSIAIPTMKITNADAETIEIFLRSALE